MKKDKFEVNEKVRVFTKFYDFQEMFWLPDDVLFMWKTDKGRALITWHGTVHEVLYKHIHKMTKKGITK